MAAPGSKRKRTNPKGAAGFFLTLPALIVMAAAVLYPMLWALRISLSASDGMLRSGTFVGTENYVNVLTSGQFQAALMNTLQFVAVTIVIELVLGFAVALVLHQSIPGGKFFRLVFTLPLMIAPVVAGLQWRWLFADQYGAINGLLAAIGVKGPLWLATPWGAKTAVLIANVWLATPFVILVLLAGLAALPEDLYEAARLDGAKPHQLFFHVTLPLLRPALLLILVVRLTDAIRVFDIVYIVTQGGPGGATEVLSSYIYKQTFNRLHFGEGTAAAFIVMVLIMLVSFAAFRILRPKGGEA